MIGIQFPHLEEPVSIDDSEGLTAACRVIGDAIVDAVPEEERGDLLRAIVSGLHFWHLMNGVQIEAAIQGGHGGIGLEPAIDAHNWVGKNLLMKPAIEYPETVTAELVDDDYEPSANEHVEAEEADDAA